MGRRTSSFLFAATALVAAACEERTLPPLPSSFVVVDTNLPIPAVVSRLRVDLYSADGTWFDTRDVALPDPRDWPTSFSVFSDDESRERVVWVRIRAYPDGRTRDYRGERRLEWNAPFAAASGDGEPRLFRAGVDVTPGSEPEPLVTVDRLVRVRLRPGVSGTSRVLLHGACIGTMPTLDSLAAGTAESCVDTEKSRVEVTELPADDDRSKEPTVAGTWLATPCGEPQEGRVCVPGGGTLIGSGDEEIPLKGSVAKASLPVRAFGVKTFWMDRTEVTVARMRAALASGFAGPAPIANDGPLAPPPVLDDPKGCTYSNRPVGREDHPVSCVLWRVARAFCQREGGDLPTEVQWEHAASMASRPRKTRYPWGNEDATCERAAQSRAVPLGSSPCEKSGVGPDAVTAHPNDVTPSGLLNIGGGVAEWVRDVYADFTAACWANATIAEPICEGQEPDRSFRGSAWVTPMLWSSYRVGASLDAPSVMAGFRCVYDGAP